MIILLENGNVAMELVSKPLAYVMESKIVKIFPTKMKVFVQVIFFKSIPAQNFDFSDS